MAEESYETTEEYIEASNSLFNLIERREEMRRLLKIAHPGHIPKVRQAIAEIDNLIEKTEKLMKLHRELHLKSIEIDESEAALLELSGKVDKKLLEYVAENYPEKLEMLKAMLSDDDKTH